MKRGVGLVNLHYAVEVPKEKGGAEWLRWMGGYFRRPRQLRSLTFRSSEAWEQILTTAR